MYVYHFLPMRNPSIHINKSIFQEILEDLEIKAFPVDAFFRIAAKKSLNSRAIVVSNEVINKKVNNVLLANKGDAQLAADLIYATRIKLKHRGVRKATQSNTREWQILKDLANAMNKFAQDYNFDSIRAAYIAYLETGIRRMDGNYKSFSFRLLQMFENICSEWEAKELIKGDKDSGFTERIYKYYTKKIADATGIYENSNIKDNPAKYMEFMKVNQLLHNNPSWGMEEFIDAQFEALAFCNGIPEPHSLHGDTAIDRYKKYIYKSTGDAPKVQGGILAAMKNYVKDSD